MSLLPSKVWRTFGRVKSTVCEIVFLFAILGAIPVVFTINLIEHAVVITRAVIATAGKRVGWEIDDATSEARHSLVDATENIKGFWRMP